jgi:hypothetical protein
MARGIVPPRASVVLLVPRARATCHGPRTSQNWGETCLVRWRLVMRGGDLSCEVETCRGDPSCRELVGDAANWPETRLLVSVGLDRGP